MRQEFKGREAQVNCLKKIQWIMKDPTVVFVSRGCQYGQDDENGTWWVDYEEQPQQ